MDRVYRPKLILSSVLDNMSETCGVDIFVIQNLGTPAPDNSIVWVRFANRDLALHNVQLSEMVI